MTEVSVAQLYDIVQSMNIVHANCRANGWEAWRATQSGSSISGAAARLLDLALPVQAAMSEEAIIEQGRSAARVAEKLLTVGGWRENQMSDWISVVRCAKSFKDFLPAVAKWKGQALHMSEDVDEDFACGPAREVTQVPGADVAWESPSGQPDVSAALEGLAKLRTKGPYIAQEALQAMLALGFIKPKLPKGHGQNVDAGVLQLF